MGNQWLSLIFETLLAVGVLTALGGAPILEAAVTVSPSRIVLRSHPTKTLTGYFTVENPGDAPIELTVEPEDWAGGIGGSRGPVPWLSLKPTKLTLRPGKVARVKYVVRVPKEATGELRAQVFFTSLVGGGSVPIRSRLGTIIYVTIKGTERIEGSIGQVKGFYTASTPGIAKPDRLELVMRIHNRGNAHIIPEGRALIKDKDGFPVADIPIPAGWGLLPNQEDAYRAIGHGIHLAPGRYLVDLTILFGSDLGQPTTLTKTLRAELTEKGEWRFLEP